MRIENFKYDDDKEPVLAGLAVENARQQAYQAKVPLYYVEKGYLVKDIQGKKQRLMPISRNQVFGTR